MGALPVKKWRHLLSYCYPQPVATANSPASGPLVLELSKGHYRLSTAHAIYSHGLHYTNFRMFFARHARLLPRAGSRLLVLGFGMGSVPMILERRHGCTFTCVGVESDPIIAGWARRYTLPGLKTPTDLVRADAWDFLAGDDRTFDMVVVDIFLDDRIPEPFRQADFLHKLATRLQPSGILLYNCLYRENEDRESTDRFFRQVFQYVFPDGRLTAVAGNAILSTR